MNDKIIVNKQRWTGLDMQVNHKPVYGWLTPSLSQISSFLISFALLCMLNYALAP